MRLMKRGTESVTFPPKTFRHFMLRLTRFPCGICAPFNHSRWHVVMMSRFDPEIDDRRKHLSGAQLKGLFLSISKSADLRVYHV